MLKILLLLLIPILIPSTLSAGISIDLRTVRDMPTHTNILLLSILTDKPQEIAVFIIMRTTEGAINHDYVVGTISKDHPMLIQKMEFGNDEYTVFVYDLETRKLLGIQSTSAEMEKIAVDKFAKANPQFVGILRDDLRKIVKKNSQKIKDGLR